MPVMRHIAETIGLVGAQHDHLLSKTGAHLADSITNTALGTIRKDSLCTMPTLSSMLDGLYSLGGEILALDDPSLVARRRFMARTWGPELE